MGKIFDTWMWWFLNLVVPLLSVLSVWFLRRWKKNPIGFKEILKDGQICFYAVAVLAASLSEILPSANPSLPSSNKNGFVTPEVIFLTFAVFAYGTMNADHNSKAPELSTDMSLAISCVIAGSAILLSLGAHYF